MPAIDVVDSTWIAARPAAVAAYVADPTNWRRWWPALELAVDEGRGDKGVRWLVRALRGTTLSGSAEVWLEPACDGVVAHFFLRLDPAEGRRLSGRRQRAIVHGLRVRTKRAFWALADELDPGRLARLTSTSQGATG